jgi:hypothetical protein
VRVIKMPRIKGFETSLEELVFLVVVHEPSVPADVRAAKSILANLSLRHRNDRNHRALRNRYDGGFEFHAGASPAL